jgi:DNA repair exonuclease SbcCD ATPase subunit
MRLRSLELEQFRKFDQPVRLSGFGDRVNVLCGPNEFGKSTILAAIRGLMFERHNSKADPIKRMQNWRGNAAPRLAMEFETGGGLWKIEKRFLSQPMARLTGPDGSRFDNDAAEEELQRLVSAPPASRAPNPSTWASGAGCGSRSAIRCCKRICPAIWRARRLRVAWTPKWAC